MIIEAEKSQELQLASWRLGDRPKRADVQFQQVWGPGRANVSVWVTRLEDTNISGQAFRQEEFYSTFCSIYVFSWLDEAHSH